MFKHFLKSIKSNSSEHSSSNHDKEHRLLPVKLYLVIFLALLLMIFLNIGISKLPIPGGWITASLLTVSTIQTILVVLFFMELIHEDKFYAFVFGSAILFMILFFSITLLELNGRDFFNKIEGIKVLRGIDQNGNYAPSGPKFEKEQEKK